MRWYSLAAAFAGFALAAAGAMAAEASAKPFDISTPQSFQAQAAQVRAGLAEGGAYAFVSARNRQQVERDIASMDGLLQHFGTIEAMPGAQRVTMFNAQASANWILTRGREGHIRCAWVPQTGSHIARTRCWSLRRP